MSRQANEPSPDLASLLRELARSLVWQEELGALGLPYRQPEIAQFPEPTPPSPPLSRMESPAPTASAPPPIAAPQPKSAPIVTLSLEEIRAELGDCRRCKLCDGRRNIVFGGGDSRAKLMFIGEAPGADEDRQGIPFVGRAGQLLTKMISAMGLTRDDVYIANIIKCRPPQNRDPEKDEIFACEPFLKRQIDSIQPDVIVSLGRVSAQTLLRIKTPITRQRGRWRNYHGVKLMPTFHPAYLLRNPAAKKDVWADLQAVMAELGLERPKRSR